MLSARVTFMSEYSFEIRVLNKFLIFRRLVVRARDTAYTEKNIRKAFESTGIYPLNPRTVLGKLKPKNEETRNITRTDGTSPPPVTHSSQSYRPP